MYCKNCGKEISDQAKECEYCGALTRKGAAFNSIKKKLYMAVGIVIAVLVVYNMLAFLGKVDSIGEVISKKNLKKEMNTEITQLLEDNKSIDVTTKKASGTVICKDKDVYIVDAADTSTSYMFYSKNDHAYKSVQYAKFKDIDNQLPTYDQFESVVNELIKEMKVTKYDTDTVKLEGELNHTDKLMKNYNAFTSLFGMNTLEAKKVPFSITFLKESPSMDEAESINSLDETNEVDSDDVEIQKTITIDFDMGGDQYQWVITNEEAKDPREYIENEILARNDSLTEMVCYDPNTDTQIAIYADNLTVDDEFNLLVTIFVNDDKKEIDYTSIQELDNGLSIDGVTYPTGSREDYANQVAERNEKIKAADEERDELLEQINTCMSMDHDYPLYRTATSSEEVYGFFTKHTETTNWLEDYGDTITITEITPELVEDEYAGLYYQIHCKGHYIYDGVREEFEGDITEEYDYLLLSINEVNAHAVRSVGFSVYRVVAEPNSAYFGMDMDVQKKDDNGTVTDVITNYVE